MCIMQRVLVALVQQTWFLHIQNVKMTYFFQIQISGLWVRGFSRHGKYEMKFHSINIGSRNPVFCLICLPIFCRYAVIFHDIILICNFMLLLLFYGFAILFFCTVKYIKLEMSQLCIADVGMSAKVKLQVSQHKII